MNLYMIVSLSVDVWGERLARSRRAGRKNKRVIYVCIHASMDATAQNLAEKGRIGLAAVYLCTTHRARESSCTRLYNRTVIRPFGKQSVARWPTCWIATRVVCDSPLLRPVYISIHRSFHSPLWTCYPPDLCAADIAHSLCFVTITI